MPTVGEKLIALLEAHGVDTVFGIPGVHTIELYRGLAASTIRHVTPRHEQGAGFMADGYARASGRPGVAFVITGPGLTNVITAMAQARADSIPMLVISGVNGLSTLGKGLGYLHELPDQRGMMEKVALLSRRIERPDQLPETIAEAFRLFGSGRAGPVHIEIPLDVMPMEAAAGGYVVAPVTPPAADPGALAEAARLVNSATRPLILAGGGARRAETQLRALAEALDAPVVTTINARGLLHRHPLGVHVSPSLKAVRALMAAADLVIALGTEFGPTDYDMYANGGFVLPKRLVRVDIDAAQLARRPATVGIRADCAAALSAFLPSIAVHAPSDGAARALVAREAAWEELGAPLREQARAVTLIRDAVPGALIVGDSTQPVYAANLFYDHDRPGGWFNAATGYGALGYGPAAAIGAAVALPGEPIICLSGDGGFQFTLPELGAALDAGVAVIFLVWNNRGYREIEVSMRDDGVEPVGVSPEPPDFRKIADAYGMPSERIESLAQLAGSLLRARQAGVSCLIELVVE
ncbi:MAG: 5-guanidino-2-oxopentanoate decarboxylase [Mesorhizobium sp.]|nr:5-guanidino-2-oxopentanoate decarboxylase [Mesorhizobium sp.]